MKKFNFGDVVTVDNNHPDGLVLMQTGSTVTVAFPRPSEFDADRFSYYTEVFEIEKVVPA